MVRILISPCSTFFLSCFRPNPFEKARNKHNQVIKISSVTTLFVSSDFPCSEKSNIRLVGPCICAILQTNTWGGCLRHA